MKFKKRRIHGGGKKQGIVEIKQEREEDQSSERPQASESCSEIRAELVYCSIVNRNNKTALVQLKKGL